jgi:fusaric acid resistance family protein
MTALRLAHRRLRSRSRAILQTAVAALSAWYLCVLVLPDPQPLFACIATVAAIGASHGGHRRRALHLMAGVTLGLTVADAIIHVVGTGAPQLALLVALAMSVAVLLGGSDIIIGEAGVSAMLLVMAGPHSFSVNRILEAAIGGAVALAVTALFPPDAELHVGRAGQAVFGQLGQALERVASALTARDADRAEAALLQARAIDGLIDVLDDALETGVETVRLAPAQFAAREPVERYARSFEQIDLAVRNTRVLARHVQRALRSGAAPAGIARPVGDLARAVWELAASYDDPERAASASELASLAAAGAGDDALGESVRSTAVDLMRAAELVAGAPEQLPAEEVLLGLAPVGERDERLRETAEAAARREQEIRGAALASNPSEDCHFVATFLDDQVRAQPSHRLTHSTA